jgi:hypothetical protein
MIFSKRDFKNIDFAEIKAQIHTIGTESDIKRMEISSNVIHLFIEGRHSLKNNTDILVQVPLSNLKKYQKDIKPANTGTNKKQGASIFLRLKTNEEGKLKVSYQPFHLK